MNEIECISLDGRRKMVQKDHLILRPAAYAIIMDKGRILLLKMRATGKYHLPGGGISPGERIEETLRREVREEAGIEIQVERFAYFDEVFFLYDPSGRAYHGLHFYYLCSAQTFELLPDNQVNDDSAESPRWVSISSLQPQDFQILGDTILDLCEKLAVQQAVAVPPP